MKRLYDWASDPMPPKEEKFYKKNFSLYFKEHDRRRELNLKDTFPELKDFITECENYE